MPHFSFLVHTVIYSSSCHFHFSYVTGSSPVLLILHPFRHFTYVAAHFPTLPSLYLRQSSFSNPSVASPRSQLILQPFFHFSYVTDSSHALLILQSFRYLTYAIAHSPTLPLLHLRHSSFSNPFSLLLRHRLFTCSAHSPGFPSLYLRHNILQPFCRFTYVTVHSLTLPLLHLRHSSFCNRSFACPTSQALHLRHLASRP